MESRVFVSSIYFKRKLNVCKTCLKLEDKIKNSKKYNPSFVEGCSNFRSAIVEHAKAEMHDKACEFEDMQEAQKLGEKYKKNDFNSKYTHWRKFTKHGQAIWR